MNAVLILLAIVALAAVIGNLRAFYRQGLLDDREEDLDEYSAKLDERANRIAAEEETLKSEWIALRQARKEIERKASK